VNLPATPDALPWLTHAQTVAAFERYGVLSERELEAREEVLTEQYVTTINIEGETAASIARTMLLPAAIRWLATLQGISGVARLTEESAELVDQFTDAIFALEEANERYPENENSLEGARYVQGTVQPAMAAVREVADRLERIVPDDLWPLPKYSEILFIK
jgi:glutamine synthetase